MSTIGNAVLLSPNTLWCADGEMCYLPNTAKTFQMGKAIFIDNVRMSKDNYIELGADDENKMRNAARILYRPNGLDILGAGSVNNRNVVIQDNLMISQSLQAPHVYAGEIVLKGVPLSEWASKMEQLESRIAQLERK